MSIILLPLGLPVRITRELEHTTLNQPPSLSHLIKITLSEGFLWSLAKGAYMCNFGGLPHISSASGYWLSAFSIVHIWHDLDKVFTLTQKQALGQFWKLERLSWHESSLVPNSSSCSPAARSGMILPPHHSWSNALLTPYWQGSQS